MRVARQLLFSPLLFVSFLLLIAGIVPRNATGADLPVLRLPSGPKPAQIAAAKLALQAGTVIAMTDADPAHFSVLFNVALPKSTASAVGTRPTRYCLIALNRTLDGRLRTFLGDVVTAGPNHGALCEKHFQKWLQSQDMLADTNNPSGWTEIYQSTVPQTDSNGNEISITPTVYRSNTTDPNHDYFMVILTNESTAAQSSTFFQRGTNIIANVAASGVWDSGPASATGSNFSFTIGSNVSVQPTVQPAYTVSWSQPNALAQRTVSSGSPAEASWFERPVASGTTSFTSYQGVVFQLAKGTTQFPLRMATTTQFQAANGGLQSVPLDVTLSISAPVLSVPSEFYVLPGKSFTMQITATDRLGWQFTSIPPWSSVDTSVQNGNQKVFVDTSGSQANTLYEFSIDGAPAFSAPSVEAGPLAVKVHVVEQLPTSGVLLAGGSPWNSSAPLATAQIWEPSTNLLTATNGPMNVARQWHTATLLGNGKILLAGGFGPDGVATNTTEIFDPVTSTFTAGPLMSGKRAEHTATLLSNGTVLIAGGFNENNQAVLTTEIYHPGTGGSVGIFSQGPLMAMARGNFAATWMQNGTVLLTGGTGYFGDYEGFGDVEFYDPTSATFTQVSGLNTGRQSHSAVLLPNGQVLEMGGSNPWQDPITSCEIYTPDTQSFAQVATLAPGRRYAGAALAPDGTVLLLAGFNAANGASIYDPNSNSWYSAANFMTEARDHPAVALVHDTNTTYDGSIVVAGGVLGNSGLTNGTAVEIYNTSSQTWSSGGLMNASRANMTATLFGQAVSPIPAESGN